MIQSGYSLFPFSFIGNKIGTFFSIVRLTNILITFFYFMPSFLITSSTSKQRSLIVSLFILCLVLLCSVITSLSYAKEGNSNTSQVSEATGVEQASDFLGIKTCSITDKLVRFCSDIDTKDTQPIAYFSAILLIIGALSINTYRIVRSLNIRVYHKYRHHLQFCVFLE